MTGLKSTELARILRLKEINWRAVVEGGGPSVRTIRKFANNPGFRSSLEPNFQRVAADLLKPDLPWDVNWTEHLRKLREIASGSRGAPALETEYAVFVEGLYRSQQAVDDQPDLCAVLFGGWRNYLGALWFTHLYWLVLSGWGAEDALTTSKKEASRRATLTAKRMLLALREREGTVAELLRFKATANIVSAQWNPVLVAYRFSSPKLRKLVKDYDIIGLTRAHLAAFPRDEVAARNALGYASAFHHRWLYAEFERHLDGIDPALCQQIRDAPHSKNPRVRKQFDLDYEDYRQWVLEERPHADAPEEPAT